MSEIGIIFVASLLNLDTTSAFQFLISRPSFVGMIVGVITGHVVAGISMGILLELMIVDFTPIAGISIPNGCCGITVSILLMANGIDHYLSFIFGFFVSVGYIYVEKNLRSFRNFFNRVGDRFIEKGKFYFGRLILFSLFVETISFFIYTFISYKFFFYIADILNNFDYILNVSKLSVIGFAFITFTSLYFRFKMQVGKND